MRGRLKRKANRKGMMGGVASERLKSPKNSAVSRVTMLQPLRFGLYYAAGVGMTINTQSWVGFPMSEKSGCQSSILAHACRYVCL
jgi:hypothetical protein